jgi:hypothetical protein
LPFIDTPISVLREILNLDTNKNIKAATPIINETSVEIQLKNIDKKRTFRLVPIPKKVRTFFPGYKEYFELETDIGTIETRVTSAPKGTPIGDKHGGGYLQGNLANWYKQHPNLEDGDFVRFEVIEPRKRYKLSIRKNK